MILIFSLGLKSILHVNYCAWWPKSGKTLFFILRFTPCTKSNRSSCNFSIRN